MPGKIAHPRSKISGNEGGFKEFRIGKLFEKLQLGMTKKKFNKAEDVSKERNQIFNLPLVNAKHGNNGIMYYGKNSDFESAEMTIDIVNDGAIATGDVYPQPQKTGVLYNAYLVKYIFSKDCISQKHLIYFASSIQKSIKLKYGYDNKAGWEKVKNEYMSLPTTRNGNIDFSYMEKYIEELQQQQHNKIDNFLKKDELCDGKLPKKYQSHCTLLPKESKSIEDLNANKINFGKYSIGQLFSIATGRDVIIGKTKSGPIPLISHQNEDNGIAKEIELLKDRRLFDYAKTISLADRGVFWATTQSKNFHIGTRVKAITFLDGEKSENIRLFFVTSINKLQVLFKDYLTNATDSLPKLEISLPITAQGNIDYDFMETFISAQKKLVAQKVVRWLEQQNINDNILKIEKNTPKQVLPMAADQKKKYKRGGRLSPTSLKIYSKNIAM